MRQITFLKINGLFPLAYAQPAELAARPAYLRQILADARECRYRMSPKEWIVTHSALKPLLRLTGLLELARRSLSYRLKSRIARG